MKSLLVKCLQGRDNSEGRPGGTLPEPGPPAPGPVT